MWSGKALFGVVVWGASFVATRIALETFTPFGLVAIRLILGAAVLLAAGLATRRPLYPGGRDRWTALFLGIVLTVHTLVQAIGLSYTSAINAGWIIGFAPVPIALGGWLFLRQRMGGAGWIGVTIATGGVGLIISATTPGFAQARTGDMLQLISCLTWALYTLAGAGAVRRHGAFSMTLPATACGALILPAFLPFTGVIRGAVTQDALLATAFLGLVCSGLGYLLWYAALKDHGAAVAGSYLYLEPFVTVAVSAALLGEPIGSSVVAGGLLVLAGVYAVARGARAARNAARSREVVEADG